MEETFLTAIGLPLALFIIMLCLGLSLTVEDFRKVVVYPKAVAVGLLNQIILLPLIGAALVLAFNLSPFMAVGIMLIAACPGGPTSNMIAFVARGDTALAILLTAISGIITIITIPLILALTIGYFQIDAEEIRAPVGEIMLQLVAIVAVPVTIGMVIRHFKPAFAQRMDKLSRIASSAVFVFVLLVLIVQEWALIREHFVALSGVTLALNVCTMAAGFAVARVLSLSIRRSVTISISSGIQNGTLAIVIATSILQVGEAAIPGGVYSLIMFITGGAIMYYFGARRPDLMTEEPDAPPAEEKAA